VEPSAQLKAVPIGHNPFLSVPSPQIAQNYFTVWIITPSGALSGSRPVDHLDNGPSTLLRALESLSWIGPQP
jgi:hypothetical protein